MEYIANSENIGADCGITLIIVNVEQIYIICGFEESRCFFWERLTRLVMKTNNSDGYSVICSKVLTYTGGISAM
jgi:hypothetical protein